MTKKNTKEAKHITERNTKLGPPTKYTSDMPEALIEFFNVDPDEYLKHNFTNAMKSNFQIIPGKFPTLIKFARSIGVSRATFYLWAEEHPEFKKAMDDAKQLQEEAVVNIGIATNGGFAAFMLKCNHGWRDNDDLNVNTQAAGDVTVVFTRGKSKDERDVEAGE